MAQFSLGTGNYMTRMVSGTEPTDTNSELAALIEAGLGRRVDGTVLVALATMQERLHSRQGELAELLRAREISPQRYMMELDVALVEASKTGEKILGYDNFHRVFGEFRVHHLGDATRFFEQQSRLGR